MTTPPLPPSRKSGPPRDFTKVGEVSAPAFARPPDPTTLFTTRAQRLADLVPDNPLGPYLTFLSGLVAIQHEAQATLPPPASPSPSDPDTPPLSSVLLSEDPHFAQLLDWFLQRAEFVEAPAEARQALARLQAMPARLALADAVREAAYPMDQLAECLFVAAAVQVHMTRLAAALDLSQLHRATDGICPTCGSPPVASMIVNWPNASRVRYCVCPLCATAWNYVRIKCTSCGSTGGIEYFLLEEQSKDITVETCSNCRGYIKHLHQDAQPAIEPIADDIASLGIDLLVQQEGFRRITANPLLVMPATPLPGTH
jgi:FdhE protein